MLTKHNERIQPSPSRPPLDFSWTSFHDLEKQKRFPPPLDMALRRPRDMEHMEPWYSTQADVQKIVCCPVPKTEGIGQKKLHTLKLMMVKLCWTWEYFARLWMLWVVYSYKWLWAPLRSFSRAHACASCVPTYLLWFARTACGLKERESSYSAVVVIRQQQISTAWIETNEAHIFLPSSYIYKE